MSKVKLKNQAACTAGAPEQETGQKNGASPKSHTSRGNLFYLSLILLLFFYGCEQSNELYITRHTPDRYTDVETLIFNSEGGTQDISLKHNIDLTVIDCPEWITIAKSFNTGNQILHLTASKNTSEEVRLSTVRLEYKGESSTTIALVVISVMQYGEK